MIEKENDQNLDQVNKQEILAEEMAETIKEECKVIKMDDVLSKEQPEEYGHEELDIPKAKNITEEIRLELVKNNVVGFIRLFDELAEIKDITNGAKWSYWITRNQALFIRIHNNIKNWVQTNQPEGERVSEFNTKEFTLITFYANKDENGNPKMLSPGKFDISEDKLSEFKGKQNELRKEYQDVMDQNIKFNEEYEKYVKKIVIIKPYLILRSNIPAGVMPKQLFPLESFIVED